MTIIEFLTLVEHHTFLVHYYAFSMLFSILLGRLFLSRMGHPRIWNYFFSLLLYMMSVLGVFSAIMFFYKLVDGLPGLPSYEILVPFFTMVVGILLIQKRVNISLLTGFGHAWAFFVVLFLIILTCILIDNAGWLSFSDWPVYFFLLFLIGVTLIIQQVLSVVLNPSKV